MDFKKFYEEQSEYSAFRNDPEKYNEYLIAITFKIKYLLDCCKGREFKNILEIGCAFGTLLDKISRGLNIGEVYGIDIAEANIKKAQEYYPAHTFYQGTLENLPKLDIAKFDLILLSDIVEHIPDDLAFLKKAGEKANYVLLNLPLEKSFVNRNRKYGEDDPSGHLHCYDLDSAFKIIEDAGLEILNYKTSSSNSYKPYRKIFLKNELRRLEQKPVFKRVVLKLFTISIVTAGSFFPIVFRKYCGSNLFCLLKPKSN